MDVINIFLMSVLSSNRSASYTLRLYTLNAQQLISITNTCFECQGSGEMAAYTFILLPRKHE